MGVYIIECIQSLGMAHWGEVTTKGESSVELTDEEVKLLVDLIREKGTTDVKKLNLEKNHPELYEKLDKAYHDVAYKAEEIHWLLHGYENGYFEYDDEEVMNYCEENCGYEFVPTLKGDIPDGISPDFIATYLEVLKESKERKLEDFNRWLSDYLHNLSPDEARNFICDHLNPNLEMDDVSYEVGIPQAIIDLAKTNE